MSLEQLIAQAHRARTTRQQEEAHQARLAAAERERSLVANFIALMQAELPRIYAATPPELLQYNLNAGRVIVRYELQGQTIRLSRSHDAWVISRNGRDLLVSLSDTNLEEQVLCDIGDLVKL